LEAALVQLQPSMFKGFSLAQQNMTIRMRTALTKHADFYHQNNCLRDALRPTVCSKKNKSDCKRTGKADRTWTLWADAIGDISRQNGSFQKKGFKTFSGGGILGADYQAMDDLYAGVSAAYSYTNIHWHQHAGNGDTQSVYGTAYATYSQPHYYVNGSLTGAYNSYFGKRNIDFLTVDRKARSNHGGGEGAAYLGAGGLFQINEYNLSPYGSADYVFLHEAAFREHGANSLDLFVGANNSSYLRGEAGFAANGCFKTDHGKWIPNIKLGVVQEWRFLSRQYKTEIIGAGCTFKVTGLRPTNRTLFAPGVSLTALLLDERLGLSIAYDGEFGRRFVDNNINLQMNYSF
jgi:uncharacterized protein with beta-barrel porin domain